MSIDFKDPKIKLVKSQNLENYRKNPRSSFFRKKHLRTRQIQPDHTKSIQKFKQTIALQLSISPLPQEQKFFPSIAPRRPNPLKMKDLFFIKQKQKRQGLLIESKLRLYRQLLAKQSKLNKSRQKYLIDREDRYDKMRNISFINLKEKMDNENRFNQRSRSVFDQANLEFRSNSLYFRTLDDMDSTMHMIRKSLPNYSQQKHQTIDGTNKVNVGHENKSIDHGKFSINKKYLIKNNYRYFDILNQENYESHINENNNQFRAIQNNFQKIKLIEGSKQRQKINQMIKTYRQYEQNQTNYQIQTTINAKK